MIGAPWKGEKITLNMLLGAENFKAFPTVGDPNFSRMSFLSCKQSASLLQQTLLNPNKNNHHHKWVLSSPKCAWIQATLCSTCQQNFIASFWAHILKQLLFIQVLALAKQQVNLKLVLCLSAIKKKQAWCLQTGSTSKGKLSFVRFFTTGYNQMHFLHDWAQGLKNKHLSPRTKHLDSETLSFYRTLIYLELTGNQLTWGQKMCNVQENINLE